MTELSGEDKSDECMVHALRVMKAWLIGSYHRLFKLYKVAPRMSSYLMDWFLPRERKQALKVIVKAYVDFPSCLSVISVLIHSFVVSEKKKTVLLKTRIPLA
jgi:hypothetical protein